MSSNSQKPSSVTNSANSGSTSSAASSAPSGSVGSQPASSSQASSGGSSGSAGSTGSAPISSEKASSNTASSVAKSSAASTSSASTTSGSTSSAASSAPASSSVASQPASSSQASSGGGTTTALSHSTVGSTTKNLPSYGGNTSSSIAPQSTGIASKTKNASSTTSSAATTVSTAGSTKSNGSTKLNSAKSAPVSRPPSASTTKSNVSSKVKSTQTVSKSTSCAPSCSTTKPCLGTNCTNSTSQKSALQGSFLGSSCSTCRPALPSNQSEMLSISKMGGPKTATKQDMKAAGFEVGGLIVEDECYQFFSGSKGSKRLVVKVVRLETCSPRYRANMLRYSLCIERYLGGAEDGKVKCASFIRVYEIFKVDNSIYVFMEEVAGKSLFLRIFDHDSVTPDTARSWAIQLVSGVQKMHEVGVAHRFLKLQHLLFDKTDQLKIAGWSKSVPFWEPSRGMALLQRKERRSRKNLHLPPECFRVTYDPSRVDMWSVGVVMVAMQTRRYPFNPTSKAKFSAQWRHFVATHQTNALLRNAVNKVFSIDPQRRSRPADFLKLPYFKAPASQIAEMNSKAGKDPKLNSKVVFDASLHVSKANAFGSSAGKPKSSMGKTAAGSKSKSVIPASGEPTNASFATITPSKLTKSNTKKIKSNSVKSSKVSSKIAPSKISSKVSSKGPASCPSASQGSSNCSSAIASSATTSGSIGPSSCPSASKGTSSCPSANASTSESSKGSSNTSTSKNTSSCSSSTTSSGVSSSKASSSSSSTSKGKSSNSSSKPSSNSKKSVTSTGSQGSKNSQGSQGSNQEANTDPGIDQATGNEGGQVSEQVPPEEAQYESAAAEAAAPEEQADQAEPVVVSEQTASQPATGETNAEQSKQRPPQQ